MRIANSCRLLLSGSLLLGLLAPASLHAEGIQDHIGGTIAGTDLAAGQELFDQEHHDGFVRLALEELTGQSLAEDLSNTEALALIREQLAALPQDIPQNRMADPPIPQWFLNGYNNTQPSELARSRYLDAVSAGRLSPQKDIAALYGFWSCYDAEWFVLSRKPAVRAWLSSVLLSYPAQWKRLNQESEAALHESIVAPLQTRDEPYRELDNWINAFRKADGVPLKPKVRDVLVQELVWQGGLESDERYFMVRAWDNASVPAGLSMSREHFMLLSALVLEFAPELAGDANSPVQLGWFRDFFIEQTNNML